MGIPIINLLRLYCDPRIFRAGIPIPYETSLYGNRAQFSKKIQLSRNVLVYVLNIFQKTMQLFPSLT